MDTFRSVFCIKTLLWYFKPITEWNSKFHFSEIYHFWVIVITRHPVWFLFKIVIGIIRKSEKVNFRKVILILSLITIKTKNHNFEKFSFSLSWLLIILNEVSKNHFLKNKSLILKLFFFKLVFRCHHISY